MGKNKCGNRYSPEDRKRAVRINLKHKPKKPLLRIKLMGIELDEQWLSKDACWNRIFRSASENVSPKIKILTTICGEN